MDIGKGRFLRVLLWISSIGLAILACGLPMFSQESGSDGFTAEENVTGISPATSTAGVEELPAEDASTEEVVLPDPAPGSIMPWFDGSLLVYVPPGEFVMGHGVEENADQSPRDNPEHRVYLDGFWIYRTEVTNRMYLACMVADKCSQPVVDPAIPSIIDPANADYPVVGVSWFQAMDYCDFVDGVLPTEAQWEKTARGPDGFPFPWGDTDPGCDLLNYDDCVGEITSVIQYPLGVSHYEVFDMAGNVFEWVYDWYREEYYPEAPFNNPMGPEFGEARSVRGSTFRTEAEQLESSLRYFLEPEEYRADLGFRCVVGKAHAYAPPCEVPAHSPQDDMAENPDEGPGGSASCIVQQPILSSVNYCIPDEGRQGQNISWTPADADVSYSSTAYVWCSQYDADTLACVGEFGESIDIEVCKSCPPPVVQLGVLAECDDPYVLEDTTGLCIYSGPPMPDRVRCAPGYSLHEDASCCVRDSGSPLDFPVCPVGGVFDQGSRICWFQLPSTGDEKCASERVLFEVCVVDQDPGDSGDDQPQDPCAQYNINECSIDDGCIWDYDAGLCRSET